MTERVAPGAVELPARPTLIRTRDMQLVEQRLGRPIELVLRDLYVTRALPLDDVARELDFGKSTVVRWLEACGIPRRPRGNPNRPPAGENATT